MEKKGSQSVEQELYFTEHIEDESLNNFFYSFLSS